MIEQITKEYEFIEHATPIRSAQDGVQYFQIEAGQTAPTFILQADATWIAFISSGARRKIPFATLQRIGSYKRVQLATPKQVKEQTGYEVGAVPLLELSLPVFVDALLLQYDFVYGGTSNPLTTVKVCSSALLNIPTYKGLVES